MSETKDVYPAECHFRIITEAAQDPVAGISEILKAYDVISPLRSANTSRQGRYRSLSVSVRLQSRDEHVALDSTLKSQAGVKIVL